MLLARVHLISVFADTLSSIRMSHFGVGTRL